MFLLDVIALPFAFERPRCVGDKLTTSRKFGATLAKMLLTNALKQLSFHKDRRWLYAMLGVVAHAASLPRILGIITLHSTVARQE